MTKTKQIAIIVAILAVLMGVGFLVIGRNSEEAEVTEEVFVEEEVEPTEELAPEFEKSDFSIAVLNGSGVAGAAGTTEEFLIDNGYDVVRTDNADSYDYVETVIQAKDSVPEEFVDMLEEDLSSEFEMLDTDTLDEDSDEDVIIIVGTDGDEAEEEDSTTDTEESEDTEETEDTTDTEDADDTATDEADTE